MWSIIAGGLIGLVAGRITKKGSSMGIVANVFAGLVGSSVGQSLLEIVGKYEKKPFKMRLLRCISFFLVANLVAKDI